MAKILSSKAFIETKKRELTQRCEKLRLKNIKPLLVVVLVGQNPASLSYVKNKKKFCLEIGADCQILELAQNIEVDEFKLILQDTNKNPLVHGIIVQLPLPWQLQSLNTSELVSPEKDVDGFHSESVLNLYYQKNSHFIPCTPSGVMSFMQDALHLNLAEKLVCLIGRSYIVGKPMMHLLNNANATVIWCHSKTKNLSQLTQQADIIISATGMRKFLNASFFDTKKEQLVIDIGITGGEGMALAGDLEVESIQNFPHLSYTPVPGGVGPLTVYKLIENLIIASEKHIIVKN